MSADRLATVTTALEGATQRFWAKVQIGAPDECWTWTGCRLRRGYGQFDAGRGVRWSAHRFSHFIATGERPPVVMHLCDNPPCVNPRHLRAGTAKANVRDCLSKGRFRWGPVLQVGGTCRNGHVMEGENIYPRRGGLRCRACIARDSAKYEAKRRARSTQGEAA